MITITVNVSSSIQGQISCVHIRGLHCYPLWSLPGGLSMIRMSNGPHSTWLSIVLSTNYEANPGPKPFLDMACNMLQNCTACQSNSDFPYFEPVPKERHHNFLVSQLQSSTERAGVKNITLCAISGFLFKESKPFLFWYIGSHRHNQTPSVQTGKPSHGTPVRSCPTIWFAIGARILVVVWLSKSGGCTVPGTRYRANGLIIEMIMELDGIRILWTVDITDHHGGWCSTAVARAQSNNMWNILPQEKGDTVTINRNLCRHGGGIDWPPSLGTYLDLRCHACWLPQGWYSPKTWGQLHLRLRDIQNCWTKQMRSLARVMMIGPTSCAIL